MRLVTLCAALFLLGIPLALVHAASSDELNQLFGEYWAFEMR